MNFNSDEQLCGGDLTKPPANENNVVRAEPLHALEMDTTPPPTTTSIENGGENKEDQLAACRARIGELETANAALRRRLDGHGDVASMLPPTSRQDQREEEEGGAEAESSLSEQLRACRHELEHKERLVEKLSAEIDELRKEHDHIKFVKQQVKRVSDTLDIVQEKENILSNMLSNTDRKLDYIDTKMSHPYHHRKEILLNGVRGGLLTVPLSSSSSMITPDTDTIYEQLKENMNKLRMTVLNVANDSATAQTQLGLVESNVAALVEKTNAVVAMAMAITTATVSSSSSSSSPLTSMSTAAVATRTTTSSSSSSSPNSPLFSDNCSSNNVLQTLQSQPQALQTSPSSLSIRSSSSASSSSSSSSISATSCPQNAAALPNTDTEVNTATTSPSPPPLPQQPPPPLMTQQQQQQQMSDVNESNVKKIILRLLSQQQNFTTNEIKTNGVYKTAATTTTTTNTASKQPLFTPTSNQNFTQCFYYLEKSATPNLVTIFKNVDEITLRDFKDYVKLKAGYNYKYRFKSLDPEFGFLKEEVSSDNKILPKCEGKIVAWIESC